MRSSILDGLARARLVRLHRQVAEAIEAVHHGELDDHLVELARHYAESATPGDADRAVRYAVRAGRGATERMAHEEAAGCFHLAVDLLEREENPDEAERIRLLLLLGDAQRLAGDPAHRETLLEAGRRAHARRDAEAAAAAALANRRVRLGVVGRPDGDRVVALEDAIDLQSSREGPVLARLLAQLGAELAPTGEWSRRTTLSERAVAMARRAGDPSALADVLVLRGESIDHPDTLDERIRLGEELLSLLEPMNEPVTTFRALIQSVIVGFEAGRLDVVDDRLERAQRLADELGHSVMGWQVKVQQAKRATLSGRIAEAAELAAAASQLGQEAGQPDAPMVSAVQDLVVAVARGRRLRVLPSIAGAGADEVNSPAALTMRAWALERAGRADEARVLLERAVSHGLDWLPADGNRLALAALVAGGALRLGLAEAAEVAIPVLSPYDDDRVVADRAVVWGTVPYFLGLAAWALGRLETAEDRLLQSIDLHRRLAAPVLLASAQTDLARVLGERGWPGDRPRQARLVAEATAAADELALGGLRADLGDLAEPS